MRRRLVLCGVCVVVALLLVCGGLCRAGEADPDLNGKPVSQWVQQLRSDNRGFQVRAARALAEAPAELHPAIAPLVIPLLKSERENDRFAAAQVLGACGPVARAAVPELIPLLQGTQFERNRAAAAKALGQILKDAKPDKEVEAAADALIAKLNEDYDAYSDVRREAMYAIGMIGPAAKKTIPKFARGLTDYREHSEEHRMVRRASAWACGRMGPLAAEHMDRLIAMLQTEGDQLPEIAEAIGKIGALNENVVMNLVDRLERFVGGWFACKAAVYTALEGFGPKALPALPYLMRVLRDTPNNRVPIEPLIASVKVIGAIGPPARDALPLLEKMKTYESHPHAEIPKAMHDVLHRAAEAAIASISGKP